MALPTCTDHSLTSESRKETCYDQQKQKHETRPYVKWWSWISKSELSNLQVAAILDSPFAKPGGKEVWK